MSLVSHTRYKLENSRLNDSESTNKLTYTTRQERNINALRTYKQMRWESARVRECVSEGERTHGERNEWWVLWAGLGHSANYWNKNGTTQANKSWKVRWKLMRKVENSDVNIHCFWKISSNKVNGIRLIDASLVIFRSLHRNCYLEIHRLYFVFHAKRIGVIFSMPWKPLETRYCLRIHTTWEYVSKPNPKLKPMAFASFYDVLSL